MRRSGWSSPASTYIICTNPRSGSWLLTEGLASTGLAGNPREWFNIAEEQRHRARWRMDHTTDLTFADYLDLAQAESTTNNGVSGVKLHYYQLADLAKKIAGVNGVPELTYAQAMAKMFPNAKLLWLTRRDKARQAISLQIASGTRKWWAIDGVANPRKGVLDDPEFDAPAISRTEAILQDNDARWRKFFDDNGTAPFVLYYEDLIADYPGAVRSVLKWLGTPDADAVTVPAARLKRQSDARNEEWLARYLSFKSQHGPITSHLATDDKAEMKIVNHVPDAWKQWVGHSKLLKTADDRIVEILGQNGYSNEAALAEVESAGSDPYLRGAAETYRRCRTGAALLNALGQMACLDSRAKSVERRSNLSCDEFRDQYYAANRPVIIQGLMANWKAMKAWTPDVLKSAAGDRTVQVMTGRRLGSKYLLSGRKYDTQMLFSAYVDKVYGAKVPNAFCMVPSNDVLQAPSLLEAVTGFPEYMNPAAAPLQSFLSLEPSSEVSLFRHETRNVLLAQVFGRKRYRLVPATQWQYVYNSTGVISDVDGGNPDFGRTPEFRKATVIQFVVEPGEVLFLPVGWWRRVRALQVNLTLSFTNFIFPNLFVWE